MVEGYGQTENGAGASVQLPHENTSGHVGAPFPSCEMKLVDVPDMKYLSTDKPCPRGEVCIRGPNVFMGYFKDPEKTKETVDAEGWLHTGDIGMMNENGTLKIVDRKKAIFKLAQGEYLAPEHIENIYLLCPLVEQIYIHGDSLQSEVVGVVVPNPETFPAWAKQQLGKTAPYKDLCKDSTVIQAFLKELDVIGKEKKLRGFEFVKAIYLESTPFSVENELLTPSFKLKRQQAIQYYRKQIDAMYSALSASNQMADKAKL
jgi:long-chain acyl-CoA synthetase